MAKFVFMKGPLGLNKVSTTSPLPLEPFMFHAVPKQLIKRQRPFFGVQLSNTQNFKGKPMRINFSSLSKKETYRIMTETIVPRPIAWVLSENENGSFNLAPFSYFNAITSQPALISLSIGYRPDGSQKDTRVNIEAREDFIIHIPSSHQAKNVTESSKPWPPGESEVEQLNLELVRDFSTTSLPRLKESPVAYHCRFHKTIELGMNNQGLIIAEIISAYINDEVVDEDGVVNPKSLDPLGRLGGNDYSSLGKIMSVERGPYEP